MKTARASVYGWVTGTGGVNHYRVLEPLRVLGDQGHPVDHGRILSNEILAYVDTVVVHMLHGEKDLEAWEDLARAGQHRMVIDVDDAMWAPDYGPFRDHYTPDVLARLYRAVEIAHVVTCTTPEIAAHLCRYNGNVHVIPNTVPAWLLQHEMPPRDRPTIGWQVSDSHSPYWTPTVVQSIVKFLNRHPEWGAHVYGPAVGPFADQPGVRHTRWIGDIERHYRALSIDVGIAPMPETTFTRAKSSLRAVVYSALGIVPVLPDLPNYRRWVINGETGRLIGKHESLAGVLAEVAPAAARVRMSNAARERAKAWTTEQQIYRWVEAWGSV